MATILELIEAIRSDPSCDLLPSSGLPVFDSQYELPDDLKAFYLACGGAWLHGKSDHPTQILQPSRFLLANYVCLKELSEQDIKESLPENHFSWGWYTVAEFGGSDEIAAICLWPGFDFGHCYDCFWESYPNRERLMTNSFTIFLEKLLVSQGRVHHLELFDLD